MCRWLRLETVWEFNIKSGVAHITPSYGVRIGERTPGRGYIRGAVLCGLLLPWRVSGEFGPDMDGMRLGQGCERNRHEQMGSRQL